MMSGPRLKIQDVFFILASVCLAVAIGQWSVSTSPAQTKYSPIESDFHLGWKWTVDSSDPEDEVLAVNYKDGRTYLFREKSITSVMFYPVAFAERLGNGFAFIEIYCGPQMTRLDVTDEEGQRLVDLISGPRNEKE